MSKLKNAFFDWAEENASELEHVPVSGHYSRFIEDLDEKLALKPTVYQVFVATGAGTYKQTIMYNREPSVEEFQAAEIILRNGIAIKNKQGPAQ